MSNKPSNGLLSHDGFCSLQSIGVTWHLGVPRHPRARGCEKQIVNPEKARNATKDKVQLSTPPVEAWYSPPFCHPFTAQNQPNLLAAGDFLECSEIMDWCAIVQGIALPSVRVKLEHIKKGHFYSKGTSLSFLESWECKKWSHTNTMPNTLVHALFQ